VAVDRAVVRVVAFVVPLAVVVVTAPVVDVDNASGATSVDAVVDDVLSPAAVLAVVVGDAVFLFPPPHAATTRLTLVATTSHRPHLNRPLIWSPPPCDPSRAGSSECSVPREARGNKKYSSTQIFRECCLRELKKCARCHRPDNVRNGSRQHRD